MEKFPCTSFTVPSVLSKGSCENYPLPSFFLVPTSCHVLNSMDHLVVRSPSNTYTVQHLVQIIQWSCALYIMMKCKPSGSCPPSTQLHKKLNLCNLLDCIGSIAWKRRAGRGLRCLIDTLPHALLRQQERNCSLPVHQL